VFSLHIFFGLRNHAGRRSEPISKAGGRQLDSSDQERRKRQLINIAWFWWTLSLLKDHHDGCIDWAEFERNQKQLAVSAFGKAGGVKSGRGGRALLAGLLSCGRCGRHLMVSYSGRPPGQPVYRCERPNQMLGLPRCFTFGGLRVDAAVGRELLRAVEPMAIEAAVDAERRYMEAQGKKQRIVELELQQARYEASRRTPLRCLRSRQSSDRSPAREQLGGGALPSRDLPSYRHSELAAWS